MSTSESDRSQEPKKPKRRPYKPDKQCGRRFFDGSSSSSLFVHQWRCRTERRKNLNFVVSDVSRQQTTETKYSYLAAVKSIIDENRGTIKLCQNFLERLIKSVNSHQSSVISAQGFSFFSWIYPTRETSYRSEAGDCDSLTKKHN